MFSISEIGLFIQVSYICSIFCLSFCNHEARGRRVSHADIWQRILRWLRLFRDSPEREVSVTHVKAHVGVFGNERADELAKAGADLRFKLTERQTPAGWFQDSLSDYWTNRRP